MIAVEATTGIDASSSSKGAAPTKPYVGVAGGRLMLLASYARPGEVPIGVPEGFTPLISRVGGSGVNGPGTGFGTLQIMTRELTGDEAGAVTLTGPGVTVVDGALISLSRTGDAWDPVVAVTGSDDTHDQNRAVTGDGPLSVEPGDMILIVIGSDRGVMTIPSAWQISIGAATFGTPVEVARQISNTDVDATVFVASVPVTGAGSGVPSFGYTYAAANCGAAAVVRVRESAGTPEVPAGTASGTFLLSGTASGGTARSGVASGSFTLDGSAVGRTVRGGSGAGGFLIMGAASGGPPPIEPAAGTASGALLLSGAAVGRSPRSGSAGGGLSLAGAAWGMAPGGYVPDTGQRIMTQTIPVPIRTVTLGRTDEDL